VLCQESTELSQAINWHACGLAILLALSSCRVRQFGAAGVETGEEIGEINGWGYRGPTGDIVGFSSHLA
jgi:hypothetical protein